MPIFDFTCNDCDKTFESITSPWEPYQCKHCNGGNVVKEVSLPAGHIWKCDSEGAAPRLDHKELDRRAGKRERLDNMYKKLSD